MAKLIFHCERSHFLVYIFSYYIVIVQILLIEISSKFQDGTIFISNSILTKIIIERLFYLKVAKTFQMETSLTECKIYKVLYVML